MTTAAELPGLLEGLRQRLLAREVRTEALARYVPSRRRLLIQRQPTMQEIGRAWPLGLLLLPEAPAPGGPLLYAEGTVTRARPEARVGYVAESARERDALRWAAARGGFAPGESVHVDPAPIELALLESGDLHEAGPLVIDADGTLRIRWARGAQSQELPAYLRERTDLLLERVAAAGH